MQENATTDDDKFVLLMGYTVENEITEYHVTEGIEYIVYGILAYKDQIRFLIQDDDGIPVFCPQELFHIRKSNVYWDWEISTFLVAGIPLLVVGYPAMERNYGKIIDLVAQKGDSINQFLGYKNHMERYGDILE